MFLRNRCKGHLLIILLNLILTQQISCFPTTSTNGAGELQNTEATSPGTNTDTTSLEEGTNEEVTNSQALLDYENETIIEKLDEQVEALAEPTVDIPPNVYEVSLFNWVEEEEVEDTELDTGRGTQPENRAQQAIQDALPDSTQRHAVRHRSRQPGAAVAAGRQANTDEPSVNLPVEHLSEDLINILRSRTNLQEEQDGPLRVLEERERFNISVDYQAPFKNIDGSKLLEIILLMRSDCSLLPERIVSWVSDKRGILFECKNGAWVVKYLKKRRRRPQPKSIQDCHEIHMAGNLGEPHTEHKAVIMFNDKEMRSYDVLCKHDTKHTNHQLIDNHISTDAPQGSLRSSESDDKAAGAWTVIQKRETGSLKFYRGLRRYKQGFGKLAEGEYWLGLEPLHEITHLRPYMLRIEITTYDNRTYFSEYSRIRVASATKKYRLKLGNFIRPSVEELEFSAGDFMSLHNRGTFHTKDMNDYSVNCARLYGTGFWFRGCWAAINLNGPYSNSVVTNRGVRWATPDPDFELRVWKTEMMIKPIL